MKLLPFRIDEADKAISYDIRFGVINFDMVPLFFWLINYKRLHVNMS